VRIKDKEAAVTQLTEFINTMHHMDLQDFTRYHPRERNDFLAIEQRVEKELVEKLFPGKPIGMRETVRDDLRAYVVERLGEESAVLVLLC
jgi:hypothetical protein